MPCTKPVQAYQHISEGTITFRETGDTRPITFACGQCMDCRLSKAREWAIRMMHESSQHEKSSFITLTYEDSQLPMDGSLQRDDLTKFLKRLRHHLGPYRYFACGEYGDTTKRAHYHACIFGHNFEQDRYHWSNSKDNSKLYRSKALEHIWAKGMCVIGDLTYETAAYTARYVTKKQTGPGALPHVKINFTTGELEPVQGPYAVMSKNPAIGKTWAIRYINDIRRGYIYVNEHKNPVPKYYEKLLKEIDPERLEENKFKRQQETEPLTEKQMRAREAITRARITKKAKL